MDFNFILSSGIVAPHGDVHPGFRLGLGLDLNLMNDLGDVKTSCRSYVHFPNGGAQVFDGQQPFSAFDILVTALGTAINGCVI